MQPVVECTGWHALCSQSDDCKVIEGQDFALCDCWKVNETHMVVTADIQDTEVSVMMTRMIARDSIRNLRHDVLEGLGFGV